MKSDEKFLFLSLYRVCNNFPIVSTRDVILTLHECGFIHFKRSLYLLRKWCKLGFYNYGVSILCGWLEFDKLPQRYIDIIMGCDNNDSKNSAYNKCYTFVHHNSDKLIISERTLESNEQRNIWTQLNQKFLGGSYK